MTLAHHGVLTRHGVLMAYILTHLLWAVLPPTDTAYMIWRVMCGSGVMTGIRALITVPVRRQIRQVRLQAVTPFFAAAVGGIAPLTVAWHPATTTTRTTDTSVFRRQKQARGGRFMVRTTGTSPTDFVFPWT